MSQIPVWIQLSFLFLLVCCSAFFSIAETSMMALNRRRLKHLVQSGQRGAQATQRLLERTDQLLAVILISNNIINTCLPVLTIGLASYYFGNSAEVISVTTALVAVILILFCEIIPKVAGARYPETLAFKSVYVLRPLVWISRPLVGCVNVFVRALFKLFGIKTDDKNHTPLSAEELHTLILEESYFIPKKHRSMLLSLFDLRNMTVDDVMVPKAKIEMLNIKQPPPMLVQQLSTSTHNKLPVYDGSDPETMLGMLHVRRAISLLHHPETCTQEALAALLTPLYYIPSKTPVLQQLQYFQENKERAGLIVNEYGEVQGFISVENIIEEIIGQTSETNFHRLAWDAQNSCVLDGSVFLRDINRRLDLSLPLEGPKTLNGLLLQHLCEIPDYPVSLKIADCVLDILHTDHHAIKTIRIWKP